MASPLAGRIGLWVAFGVLLLHALSIGDYAADDAYISLRYADNLLQGLGPVWSASGPDSAIWVEGYSNPTWVLATALLGALGLHLLDAARVLGLLCGLGTAWIAWGWAGRGMAGTAAALLVALAPPIAVWAVGGLEANLIALCLAGALANALPQLAHGAAGPGATQTIRPTRAGLWLALLVWSRPDGALLAGLVGLAHWLAMGRAGFRSMWTMAVPPTVALLVLLLIRWGLYGEWLPNTAQIKGAVTWRTFIEGWHLYVLPTLEWLIGPAALLLLTWQLKGSRLGPALCLITGVWLLYLTAVGGDLFPGRRHAMPLIVCGAFAGGALFRRSGLRSWPAVVVAMAMASLVLSTVQDPANQRARSERWEHLAADLGRTLNRSFAGPAPGEGPLLAASPAGALPFESRLPCIDMLGLSDRHIARQPITPGTPYAHNHGDMAYVLEARPDLIAFGGPWVYLDSLFAPFQQVKQRAAFFQQHDILPVFSAPNREQPTPFAATPDFKPQFLWLRRDGRLGMRIDPEGTIHIPGHLFATIPGRHWFADGAALPRNEAFAAVRKATGRGNKDAVLIAGEDPRSAEGLFLTAKPYDLEHTIPPGTYRLQVDQGSTTQARSGGLVFRCGGEWMDGTWPGATITIQPDTPLQLRVEPPRAIRKVTLTPLR